MPGIAGMYSTRCEEYWSIRLEKKGNTLNDIFKQIWILFCRFFEDINVFNVEKQG